MVLAGNDFYSSVIEAAPDGILVVDSDGLIEFANQRASELFLVPHDDLVGSQVDELLPGDLRKVHSAHRLRYRAEPSVRPMGIGMLLPAMRSDGRELPVEVSLSPISGVEGFHVVVVVRDVSARVEAEEGMRRVLLTLDATEDAVFILDADTLRFSYVNEGASRQVAYSREDLIGMTPMHINPDLTEDELHSAVEAVRHDYQAAISLRTTHLRRDGAEVPVEMSLQSAPPSRDGTVAVVAVARDISARLAADEQFRRSERAVREAGQVMAIAEDRERIARDLHDTVIQRLFACGLALEAVTARVEPEVGKRIDGIVDDLDQTIREIRTAIFALHAAGSMDEPGWRSKILEVLQQAADVLGFEPRLHLAGPIETMDDQIAEQLIPTLREALANVAKHASASSVVVTVEVGDDVVLTVLDDGVGLSEESTDALAEPDEGAGGHGLRNMRARADDLSGSVRLDAADPRGTRLVWQVPREPPAREPVRVSRHGQPTTRAE